MNEKRAGSLKRLRLEKDPARVYYFFFGERLIKQVRLKNMHKTSKILALILMAVLLFNSIGVAEASTSKPSSIWDWTNGKYSFRGSAKNENLYTNYRFTNMTTANITVTNNSSSYSVTVKLKSVEPWYRSDKTLSTAIIPAGGTCTWSRSGLDSDKQYYIVFEAPCYFSGSISR